MLSCEIQVGSVGYRDPCFCKLVGKKLSLSTEGYGIVLGTIFTLSTLIPAFEMSCRVV